VANVNTQDLKVGTYEIQLTVEKYFKTSVNLNIVFEVKISSIKFEVT
jgi:5-hydroxyisourate hydrolase-like protein (transthyretin family)